MVISRTANLQSGRKNQEIDQTRQSSDAQVLNSNDPGGCCRSCRGPLNSSHKALVLGGADDAHRKDTDHVESHKTVEDELCQTWDGMSRVLDLSGRDGEHVGASDRESGVDNH